jgi:hypothetical protein
MQMITKTTTVAKLLGATNFGHGAFNDKLKDGRRSLKVYGWSREKYEQAATMLRALGCEAEVVTRKTSSIWPGQRRHSITRMHVKEIEQVLTF